MQTGDIISYTEMCMAEGYSLQRGMNFQVGGGTSVILMSVRKGAPYSDQIEDEGKTLIYEGHDVPKNLATSPKSVNQQMTLPSGKLTQNGKFFEASEAFKKGSLPDLVTVYEKIKDGIWVYNGVFAIVDAWIEKENPERRDVFKFKLQITNNSVNQKAQREESLKGLDHNRMIPTSVKLEVWSRDKGKCIQCGSCDNLHFDHILPFSKGGTSLKADNIQLLCARHNLQKSNRII